MPFVKVSRDKRGYEQISLMHAATRRGKPSKPRALYVFRTPPGIKIGRAPFDESIQRELEAQNPEIHFDWGKLSNIPVPSPDVEYWRERRRVEKAAKQARREANQEEALSESLDMSAPPPQETLLADFGGDGAAVDIVEDAAGEDATPDGLEVIDEEVQPAGSELQDGENPLVDAATGVAPSGTGRAAHGEGHPAARRRRRRGGRRRHKRPSPQDAVGSANPQRAGSSGAEPAAESENAPPLSKVSEDSSKEA